MQTNVKPRSRQGYKVHHGKGGARTGSLPSERCNKAAGNRNSKACSMTADPRPASFQEVDVNLEGLQAHAQGITPWAYYGGREVWSREDGHHHLVATLPSFQQQAADVVEQLQAKGKLLAMAPEMFSAIDCLCESLPEMSVLFRALAGCDSEKSDRLRFAAALLRVAAILDKAKAGKLPADEEIPEDYGRLWLSADNRTELVEWEREWRASCGVRVVTVSTEVDREIIHVVIELKKSRALEILGYTPEADEWMEE